MPLPCFTGDAFGWIKDKINAIRRGTGIGSKDDLAALEKAQKLWQDMYDVATARQNEKVIGKEKGEIDQVAEEQKDSPDPKPIGRGVFGSIYDQFKGKAKEAINFLLRKKEGNAVAALHHKDVGDIDLCYGNDKAGLKKIAEKHPEVLDNLQGVIDGMEVVRASDNRVILESSTHKAVVSKMLGDKKTDNWLLSAYEKKGISASSSDIETEPQGKRNGTAAPQNSLSESKYTDSSSNPQEKIGENDADARLSVRNSGYTTRDDGTSLSNRAKDAEDEGSFTAGKFKSRYKVSGDAFDALEKLGVVEKSEWHHTGKRFKESDFFSWKDSDHIGGDTDYGAGEQAGLHARYMENKREIDRLAADFKKRSWEYEDEEPVREMSYDQFCGDKYRRLPVLSREEYLTEDQKREKERLHAEISGNERGLSSYGRYLEHRDVDERYDGLAFENYKKTEEETLRPEYEELERENAARMERNRTLDERNARTDGKEAAAVKMLELMGYGHDDALREVKSASKIGKRQEAMERREQHRREAEAEYEKKAAVIDGKREKWLADYMKKGKVREVTRVPLSEAPENFVETKREMNGRYGWFESSARYNLPEYVSGYAFDSKRLADSYRKFDEQKKDAYRELVSGADLDFDPVETSRRNSEMRRSEQEETGNEAAEARFSIREEDPPKKTVKVYKLMRLGDDGKLYPLFIDAAAPTELGVWYNADSPNLDILRKMPSGTFLVDYGNGSYTSLEDYAKEHGFKAGKNPPKDAINDATASGLRWVRIEDTGKGQRRYGGESRRYWNLGINGSGAVSEFAMRPGWHAGSLPSMRQIGKGRDRNLRDDRFVWVEGEVPADIDYQQEADRNPDRDIPTHIPENGYYLKATNANAKASQADRIGWYVAGAFKANRIISDAEARRVVDEYNAKHPDADPVEYDYEREGGKPFTDEQAQEANRRFGGAEKDYGMDAHKIAIDDRVAQRKYLMGGNYVSSLTGDEFAKSETPLTERVAEYYAKNYDGRVERVGFGIVVLDKRGVKDSLSHGIGRSKAAAFAAVPDIIRDGVLIDQKENWKKRNYDSYTIAAPVEIGGEGYVGVAIVTRGHGTNTNKFYLHEVVLQKNLLDESIKTDTEADSHRGDIAKILKEIVSAKENVEKNGNDARFSVSEAESGDREERTLMGVHNISERKLADAIRLGGLANPSLAVIDTKNGMHTDYGKISLIPRSDLIDSRSGRNAGTWAGDAWTPTYPQVEKIMSDKGRDAYYEDVRDVSDNRELTGRLKMVWDNYLEGRDPDNLAYWFFKDQGVEPEKVFFDSGFSEEQRKRYAELTDNGRKGFGEMSDDERSGIISMMAEQEGITTEEKLAKYRNLRERNAELLAKDDLRPFKKVMLQKTIDEIDKYGLTLSPVNNFLYGMKQALKNDGKLDVDGTLKKSRDKIQADGMEEDFRHWLEEKERRYGVKEMLFDGYTRDGDRKYVPNTVENASRMMNREPEANSGGQTGFGASRAMLLEKMHTLADIRKQKGKLKGVDEDSEKLYKAASDEMFEVVNALSDMQKISDNPFSNVEYANARLNEALGKKDPIGYLNKEFGYKISKDGEFSRRLKSMVETLGNLPVKYFETKFRRPVRLNEFAVAVVPEKTSAEVVKALKDAGLDVRTYDGTEEGRQKVTMDAVRDRDDVRFSLGDPADTFKERQRKAVEMENLERVNQVFNARLDELTRNPNLKNRVLQLGRPSKFLLGGGISDGPIILEYDKFVRKSSMKYKHNHPFSAEDIKDLPKAINNPIAVFNSKNVGDKVILTELQKDGKNFIVAVRAKEQSRKGGVILEINEIKTLYPKNVKGIVKWFIDGYLTQIEKEKALRWIEALRPHVGTTISNEELNSAAKVIDSFENSKFSDEKNSDDSTDKEYEDALRRGDNDRAKRLVDDRLAEYLKGHSYTRSDVAQLFGDVMHRHEEDAESWGIRFDKRLLVPEDVFPNSHELYQDYMEDDDGEQLYPDGEGPYSGFYDAGELDGTSTLLIGNKADIEKALSKPYAGNYVYLVAGDYNGEGRDAGEVLIGNAKVFSVMSIPKGVKGVDKNNDLNHRLFTNKSIDTATYDDNGNLIPLSQRFNQSADDVRFSLGDKLSDPMGSVRGAVERVGKAEDRERDVKEQFDRTRQRGIDTADRILDDATATDKQKHRRMTDVIREVTRIDGLRKAGKETVRERVRSIADTLTEMIPATDELTRGEVKRLIGKIDKAMDVKDVKRNVREAVNIVLKSAERDVDAETVRLRKTKGKRLDADSQLKQGQLDLKGQHVLDEFNRVADDVAVDLDQLEQQYSGEMGNMDLSEVQRANAADKLDGVKLAQLYRKSVKEKDQNISELNEMKRAEEEKIYNFRKRLVFDADGNVVKNKRTGEVRTETVKIPVIQSVI